MTFRGINRDRLQWLLRAALSSEELSKFFKDRRQQLVMKGDKQNSPQSHDEAIARVIRFSEGAHQVLADWLQTRPKSDFAVDRTQLLPYFRAIEELGLRMKSQAVSGLALSGLLELYSKEPDGEYLSFLATKIGERKDDEREGNNVAGHESDSPSLGDIDAFAKWSIGRADAASITNKTLRFAAQLADAARTGDLSAVEGQIAEEFRASLHAAYEEATLAKRVPATGGFKATVPPPIAPDPAEDYCKYDVVAVPFGSPVQGTWFLDVVAVMCPDGPVSMTHEDLRHVFPDEGRIILHPDAGLPAPQVGVCESYRVVRFKTPRRIKVKVVDAGARITPVIYVPHQSDERDSVREWILKHRDSVSGGAVFVLADGLCIRARDVSSFTLTGSFDWTFEAWDSLTGVELPQGPCIIGGLPPAVRQYECTPPGVLARRALKLLSERREIKITKAQLSVLAAALSDVDLALPEVHRERIVTGLRTLSAADEHFTEFVSILLTAPDVQRELEKQKAIASEAAQLELTKERESLEKLKREADTVRKRLEKLEAEEAEQSRQIKLSVRKAFESARDRGVETLGQLAVWQELLGHSSNSREHDAIIQASPQRSNEGPLIVSHAVQSSDEAPSTIFELCGFASDEANHLAESIRVGASLGLPILIEGPASSFVSTRLAAALAKIGARCIDVPVGLLSSCAALDDACAATDSDVVVLRSANLSDLSTYGPGLLLRISESCARPPLTRPDKILILAGTSGPAALDWPRELDELALRVNLGEDGHHKGTASAPNLKAASPLRRKVWARIERTVENTTDPPAKLLNCLARMFVNTRRNEDAEQADQLPEL
jgi:hypothetical protein